MNRWPSHPVVYEINTWVWLNALSRRAGRALGLADVPEAELARVAERGFDGVWLMGVWERSPGARDVARTLPGLRDEYRHALPDYTLEDVVGSPYAVGGYHVDPALGGDAGLAALRQRLERIGVRLILDFVPNHLAIDHRWIDEHPDRLLQGDDDALARAPQNWFRRDAGGRARIFAHGRDPYFDGWSDTVQLDYRRADTRRAMRDSLLAVADRADGVRCDMAMLLTHEVFLRTWGGAFDEAGTEFWPDAIAFVKARHPDFLTMAEVYWDLEWALQQQGFDYTYDKRLYDRVFDGDATAVRAHLGADVEYQGHLARFVENHDEPRALASFGPERVRAAAVVTLALPGLRLVHEGQIEGWRLKLPVQLGRRHPEDAQPGLEEFYRQLLTALRDPVFHEGAWRLLDPREAWPGNTSHRGFVISTWSVHDARRVVAVNLGADAGQCLVPLELAGLGARRWHLRDVLGDAHFVREGDELLGRGLYLDMPGRAYHLFEVERD